MFNTYISCNAAETLQFEDLAVKKFNFKNMCACFREKSKIVSSSTFDQLELKKYINILTKMCTVCKKGHFLLFLAHCTHFGQNIYFFFIHVDPEWFGH